MMGETTEVSVTTPEPAPHHPAPSPAVDQSHLALAIGELKGELTAQRSLLETSLEVGRENAAALQEIAARTELLLTAEELEPESVSTPEPVAIPPPLLAEIPPDPTTPESTPPAPPKRRMGMLHGW